MKKTNLLIVLMMLGFITSAVAQSDTIAGWTFPDSTDTNFNANVGLAGNLGYDIRAEDSSATTRQLTYTVGATDFAATSVGWDNGVDNKFWSVKFKASGYTTFKLSSKQFSDSINAGPKFWKIQCRKSGDSWLDVTGGTITAAHDWTTGAVVDIALPASLDNPGNTSIYIRWIMTSNESLHGVDVLPTGVTKIDDIIITGVNSIGVETVLFNNRVQVYPNPTSDILCIEAYNNIENVSIFDLSGKLQISCNIDALSESIDIKSLKSGIYIVNIKLKEEERAVTRKVLVQ